MTDRHLSLLSARQTGLALISGVVLWFVAALLIKALIPLGALDDGARALTYALVIPGTAPFVWLIARIAKLSSPQVGPAMALLTGAAVLCDGIALGWFPGLYAADEIGARLAGAVILWGGGVAIMLGFVLAGKVGHE